MPKIYRHEYIDGFYRLSSIIDGKEIGVTYSDNTKVEEAYADFENYIKEELQKCRTQ